MCNTYWTCWLSRSGKESSGAGAVDEEDFIRAFEDVPAVQVSISRLRNANMFNNVRGR